MNPRNVKRCDRDEVRFAKPERKAMATKKARRTVLLVVAGVDILRIEPRL